MTCPLLFFVSSAKRGEDRTNKRTGGNKQMNQRMCPQEVWGPSRVWAGIMLYHNSEAFCRQLLGRVLETWEWKSGFRTRELEPQARV